MKKLLIILTCAIGFISFLMYFSEYSLLQFEDLLSSSGNISKQESLRIPDTLTSGDLELLKKAAEDNYVNIFRRISYLDKQRNKNVYEDYVYLTTETQYLSHVTLKRGRLLDASDMSNAGIFLSTTENKLKGTQIALFANIDSNKSFTVYILDHLLDSYLLRGYYDIEGSDENFNKFINQYVEAINEKHQLVGDVAYTYDDFVTEKISPVYISLGSNYFIYLLISIIMFCIFIVSYFVSYSKHISVLKLMGYKDLNIYFQVFFKFFLKASLILVLLCLILTLCISQVDFQFTMYILVRQALIYTLIFLYSLICILYIKRIDITYCVKGKKPYLLVFIFNMAAAIVFSMYMIYAAVNIVHEIKSLYVNKSNLQYWSAVDDYAAFTPVNLGNKWEIVISGVEKFPLDVPLYNIYPYFNSLGAIYINSYEYEEGVLSSTGIPAMITVNPNYLDLFNVVDMDNESIHISESEEKSTYLVPDIYRPRESELLNYYRNFRDDFLGIHVDYYGVEPPFDKQEVQFIYIPSGQEIFSLNTTVSPERNNMITSPIISIMTEANSLIPDRFYASSRPYLFNKLLNNDTEATYESYYDTLLEHDLETNLVNFVKPHDIMLNKINSVSADIRRVSFFILIAFCIFSFLLYQNIYLLLEHRRYLIFIKTIFGYSFVKRYGMFFGYIIIINLLEFLGYMLQTRFQNLNNLYPILMIKVGAETLLTALFITVSQNSNKIKILKRG